MIQISGVTKQFPGTSIPALNEVSFEIQQGSFFTLFGPSGCGKSTLLRCIAGLESPEKGEISIAGQVVYASETGTYVPPNHRRIGMVFQSYAIWPHMTVLRNVTFPLEVQRKPNAEARARAALESVGLGEFESRYASKLSGGQQQRVALARAIVSDPAVLLLDEPLSNLDAALRDHMRGELQSLQKRIGLTTVYVTHDQTEALSMSDRIAVMSLGRCLEIGSPNEIYYHPQSAFTARLIGGANVLEGTAARVEGVTVVDTPFGRLVCDDDASGSVEVFIRPDKVVPLREQAEARAPANAIECAVREKRFAGVSTELDLVLRGGGSDRILRSRLPTGYAEGIGEHVTMYVDPADVRIFARDGAAH